MMLLQACFILTQFPYAPLKDANDGRSLMTMETMIWVKVEGKTSIGDKKTVPFLYPPPRCEKFVFLIPSSGCPIMKFMCMDSGK